MTEKENQAIVFDIGSSSCKAGIAGNEEPSSVIPSILGTSFRGTNPLKDIYIGEVALANIRNLTGIKYPIERGRITDYDSMEKIWHETFYNQLKVDPSEHPILIADAPLNSRDNKEKIIQIMFETFNVPYFYLDTQAKLGLYTTGRVTGLGIDIGDQVTSFEAVYYEAPIPNAVISWNFGGKDLTDFLRCEINQKGGTYFQSFAETKIINDLKEKKSYVALDFDGELFKAMNTSECESLYDLPDGNQLKVSKERFKTPEGLFQPHLISSEYDGITSHINEIIKACPIECRKELYANIVLGGGSSLFEGIRERLEYEIIRLAPPETKVRVIGGRPDFKYFAWLGGSIVASLENFEDLSVSKDQYQDVGQGIVHRIHWKTSRR